MKEVRDTIGQDPELSSEFSESLRQPIELLQNQMRRLALKKKKSFKTFEPATATEIEEVWTECLKIDPDLMVYLVIFK